MDKHIYRSFVIAVTSSDEFDDSVTHVAVELRPSAVLYLVIASLLAWLIRKLIGWLHFYHLEVSFHGTTWLNLHNLDTDFPEDGEEDAVVDEIDPALISEARLIGYCAQITGDGGLWFVCAKKHSGTEFISHEIELRELVNAIRLSDVFAELREWTNWLYQQHNPGSAGQPA
jgi:hypothetical protein